MAKSALEKYQSAPEPYVQVLDKAMPWALKGAKMVISSPPEIDRIIRKVPKGKVIRFEDLRLIISRKHQADVTCPLTTGIFLNIASNAAEEQKSAGGKNPLAWWRALKGGDELNPKAPGGVDAHRKYLEAEGINVITKPRGKKLIVADIDKYAVPISNLI